MKNEEKCLKRFLKRKLSFNVETLVKFLITGTLAFSVTACGGGGSSTDVRKTINNIDKTIDDANHLKKETDKVIKDGEKIKSKIDEERDKIKKAEKKLKEVKNKDEAKKINKEIDDLEKSLDKLKTEAEKRKEQIINALSEFYIGDVKTYEVKDETKGKVLVGTITGGELYPKLDKYLDDKYKIDHSKDKYPDDDEPLGYIGLLTRDKNFKTRSKVNIKMENVNKDLSFGVYAIESDFENLRNIKIKSIKVKNKDDYEKKEKYLTTIGIWATNSNIENSGNIEIYGDDSMAIAAVQSKANLGKKAINKGTIKGLEGAGGLSVANGMTGINDGTIEGYGEETGGLGADRKSVV